MVLTQYNRFSIDCIATGSTTAPSEAEFTQKGLIEFKQHRAPYDSTNYIVLGTRQANVFASSTYMYFRVRYRKSNGDGDVLGPWKRVNNNKLTSGSSFP